MWPLHANFGLSIRPANAFPRPPATHGFEEEFRVAHYIAANIRVAAESFIAHPAGQLDVDIRLTLTHALIGVMGVEAISRQWEQRRDRGSYPESFARCFDDEIIATH